MDKKLKKVEKKIKDIEKDLEKTKELLEEARAGTNSDPSPPQETFMVIPYFSHTVRIPQKDDESHIHIIGSFSIQNKGSLPLRSPHICLKLNTTDSSSFTGRISPVEMVDQGYSPVPMQTWNYLNEDAQRLVDEKGEYWLAPLNVNELSGGTSLSFANFQVKVDRTEHKGPFKIEGFVYGKEIKEGLPALNKINLSL
ncbi:MULTISPECIES: hypothetical protein [Pontibacillus]|uniref:DUF4352 domain-containing protein n=1 Tax=Pontibacillus chungwhensis TaxID=265426 RepID=A0ABY8UYT9_9BACI|nr:MULTISPECIES: hypothetical protein [Pontibacillus]MCD5325535.1 hypothetical protein [Pontibacillus sp. HN14]WIF98644.1 hypothetical protein QNI29_02960 [Pontibacillus chungwhensis]